MGPREGARGAMGDAERRRLRAPVATCGLVLALASGCGRELYAVVPEAGAGSDAGLPGDGGAPADAASPCVADACGLAEEHDLVAALIANTVPGAGTGTPSSQLGVGGWWYRYHPRTSFDSYGNLPPDAMDPASLPLMEVARASDLLGWYASAGLQVGQRGVVWLAHWDDGLPHTDGDAITILPENSVQVVLEWRAPSAGLAELDVEVAQIVSGDGDVEVHAFSRTGGLGEELLLAYVSYHSTPDAYGHVPETATQAAPMRLVAATDLAAGDGLFVYVRVGDDDSSDALLLRGGVRFRPR